MALDMEEPPKVGETSQVSNGPKWKIDKLSFDDPLSYDDYDMDGLGISLYGLNEDGKTHKSSSHLIQIPPDVITISGNAFYNEFVTPPDPPSNEDEEPVG